jgi:hypothetical protein
VESQRKYYLKQALIVILLGLNLYLAQELWNLLRWRF